ncbi:Uncharacterized conserved protein [Phaffia rhodozyma]|uniref:Vacuolar protein sorting-associated protein 51 homolog n=1 Tax=Phaffia rhodozyma TaxID=264483 RepID=A0A0F7SWS2_PHARH|nr:Uncharacterized conserved protein [Phaffia rhodozyma]
MASTFSTPPSTPEIPQLSPPTSRPTTPATSNSVAGQTPTGTARSSRARDLLRAHYKLDGSGSPKKEGEQDDTDLDSRSFNPSKYYASLLSSSSLPQLLKIENDLSEQIRLLDSERHGLVYNHHHELVSASSTLQKMNSQTSPLADSLDQIRSSFSSISQLTASLSLPSEVDKPAEIRAIVREVGDLKERLGDLIELGRRSDAQLALKAARPLLEHWISKGVRGADRVLAECEDLVKDKILQKKSANERSLD